jgi:hypothetical protein
MAKYIIAVKRDQRDKAPASLAEPLQDIEGLEICGDARRSRLMVEASAEAIEEVKQRLGEICYIELTIEHRLG